MNWIDLAQKRDGLRLLNAVMKVRFPYNAENFLTGGEPVSFSRTLVIGVS